MGEVYRARDTRLGRDVAIKVLPTSLIEHSGARARFEREAKTISGLNHPNICVLHDIGSESGVDYLVMELVDGESLATRLTRGPLATIEVLKIGTQIAEALERAHRTGIVHRDLKPGNVMLAKSGAKLMDFGLARVNQTGVLKGMSPTGGLTQSPTVAQPLTMEGAIVGTFQYMAPEQLEGREVDARADIWALGCMLYEMATGQPAFDGATPASLISSIMKDEPRPIAELLPLAPTTLDRVVRACLAKDPEQRWQNAHDVAVALRWPVADATSDSALASRTLIEREFVITAAEVRLLAERNPRLVGYPVTYTDNDVASDTLVVFLHGLAADSGHFENVLRASRHRSIAVTLVGFGRAERRRPSLGLDDHSRILGRLLRELVNEVKPRRTVLVGHSAGADHLLRMFHSQPPDVPISGLIALGPNVSLDTCFATRLYAKIDSGNPEATLAVLKSLAADIDSLETWLVVQSYFAQMFLKLGTDLEPLRRYASDLVRPFELPGDPLADWYLSARRHVPQVRLVFSNEEAAEAEALLARHLDDNVLGDDFTEASFVTERMHHLALLDPDLISRHVDEVLSRLDR
jgi:serine/threonine protein kinase